MSEEFKSIDVVRIQMVKELSMEYRGKPITNPKDASDMVKEFLGKRDRECFGVICADTKNQPTHISIVSIGSLNSSIVHPREVFKPAILSNAASIIIFHNHPSGNVEPSQSDLEITKRIAEASHIININLLDHIIVGDESYLSMKEKLLL